MADPFTIQRFPTGTLDILGMQSSGETPKALAQQLVPTVDYLDFYLRDRWETVQGSALTISSTGSFSFIGNVVVPAGEQWLLHMATIQTSAQAAGTTGRYKLSIIFNSSGGVAANMQFGDGVSCAAGEWGIVGYEFRRPRLLRQGDTLGMWCESYTGVGNTLWFGQMLINKLKV